MGKSSDNTIYINGRFLAQNRTGVQRYSREVVSAIDSLLEQKDCPSALRTSQWRLLAPKGTVCDLSLRQVEFCEVGRGSGHLWEQVHLSWHARSGRLLSTANSGPVDHRRQIVVIHDAAIYNAPGGYAKSYRVSHKILDHLLAGTARIATVSRFSQRQLAKSLDIPLDDILLAPNGADHFRSIQPDPAIVPRLQLQPGSYFVALGLSSANKNIPVAIEAFVRLRRPETRLVVIGEASGRVAGAHPLRPGAGVIYAGQLNDQEVAALLRSAAALVFPSRYEGFGIPPLEAMAQGCPVIASTADAVMEVCGGAALHFHPDDVAALTNLMTKILDQPRSVAISREMGLRRSSQFCWTTAATSLMQGLQDMVSAGERSHAVVVHRNEHTHFGGDTLPMLELKANSANEPRDLDVFSKASGTASMPLLRAQRPFWVGQQLDPDSRAFNVGRYVELTGDLDADLFEKAVDICLAQTEVLRLRLFEEDHGVRQSIGAYTPGVLQKIDFSSHADAEALAARWMEEELNRRYDIGLGRGYAWSLIRVATRRYFFVQLFHHLVIDGVSLHLVTQRVRAIYESLIAGGEPSSPAVPTFASLIEFEAGYSASEQFESDRQYWKERLEDCPQLTSLSKCRTTPNGWTTRRQTMLLSAETVAGLKAVATRLHVSVNRVIVGSIGIIMHRLTGSHDFLVGLVVTGRSPKFRNLPAPLVNSLPIRFRIPHEHTRGNGHRERGGRNERCAGPPTVPH